MVNGKPFGIMVLIFDLITDYIDDKRVVSKHTWKLTFNAKCDESEEYKVAEEVEKQEEAIAKNEKETLLEHSALMKIELHVIEKDSRYMVSATRLDGSAFAFF